MKINLNFLGTRPREAGNPHGINVPDEQGLKWFRSVGCQRLRPNFPAQTDLAPLRGARVAIITDDDNVRISTQRQGRRFSYRALLERVARESRMVAALAVVTAALGDQRRWRPLHANFRTVRGSAGSSSSPGLRQFEGAKALASNALHV